MKQIAGEFTLCKHLNGAAGKFLNLYEPISHHPQEGDFSCIRSLVEHIFGEQYELGMDYLQLLYLYPVQKLPILLLVSEERDTGKSTFLKSIIQKAKKWFPLFQELVYMEKFCLKVGFNVRQTATLISGKPLFYEGELYSEEHKRKFRTEEAGFQVVKAPKDKSKLAIDINGQVIGEWFKEQFDRLFSYIRRTVTPHRKNKGLAK